MITFQHKGDFNNTTKFLTRRSFEKEISILKKYGEEGVKALREQTPKNTGLTASSWYYRIVIKDDNSVSLQFCNSNIQNNAPIAVLLQYGHATRSGTWVEGRDYINPAIQPIFDKISEEIWKEVTK